ncbi:MAG: hypothetical protein ACJ0G2_04585 [Gammaproteobacteria bacterium]
MSEVYAYEGFIVDFSLNKYIFSWVFYIFACIITPKNFIRISDYFVVLAVTALIAPLATLVGIGNYSVYPLFVTVASILLIVLIIRFLGNVKFSFPIIRNGRSIAVYSSTALVGLVVALLLVTGAAFNLNFDLSLVYEFRSTNAELSSFGIFAYINNWVYQVINVFLISYFLLKRRWALFVFFCCLQIFFFGVSAHKSVLFYPLLIVSIWYYLQLNRSLIVVPVLFSGVIIFSFITYIIFSDIFVSALFIRRVFFIPAMLTINYFDFFSNNPFIYWSNSVLSSFIDYPYAERMTILIGQYRGTEASANNGYISSGYAHAGVLGVFLYSLILGVIMSILNSMTRNTDYLWFYLALVIVPIRAVVISSDLFTSLLTHGLLISILLIFLVRQRKSS